MRLSALWLAQLCILTITRLYRSLSSWHAAKHPLFLLLFWAPLYIFDSVSWWVRQPYDSLIAFWLHPTTKKKRTWQESMPLFIGEDQVLWWNLSGQVTRGFVFITGAVACKGPSSINNIQIPQVSRRLSESFLSQLKHHGSWCCTLHL